MSRMYDRLEQDQVAIGAIMPVHGFEWVEILGYVGFDWVTIDMMVSSLGWSEVAEMVLAAKRYDLTPWVRLSSYPWGSEEHDAGLPAQVLRALALGAECVMASVSSPGQVERMLHPLTNPHRRSYILQGRHEGGSRTEAQAKLDALEPRQRVFPCIETLEAVENIGDLLDVSGVDMVYLAMGDLTIELGRPNDDQHPAVREAVGGIVEEARKRGAVVAANITSPPDLPGADLAEQINHGVQSLWELGVRVIKIPRPPMVLQRFYEKTFDLVRTNVPGGHP